MRILKTIAVDDEAPAMRRLVKMVEGNHHLKLIGTARSFAEAKVKIQELRPDLLLLDIQLKDGIAFDLLSEVENNFRGKVIFTTAYDQYAVKAFDLEAVDYLLKPFTQERFNAAIQKIITRNESIDIKNLINLMKFRAAEPKMLMIPEGSKNHFIENDKLEYLISEGYYVNFKLSEGRKMIRISLKKLEELLPGNFLRVNKSTIVNKDFISESTKLKSSGKVTMSDGNEFFISENYLEKFLII